MRHHHPQLRSMQLQLILQMNLMCDNRQRHHHQLDPMRYRLMLRQQQQGIQLLLVD